jgi:hypothetical protein
VVKLIGSWGAFLAGDQSGDRGQDGVEVLASAEGTGQVQPGLQVADAVLHTDPLGGVGLAFGLVRRGDRGEDRQLILPPDRPRSEHRTGYLRTRTLTAGVGEHSDARGEGQQSTRPA